MRLRLPVVAVLVLAAAACDGAPDSDLLAPDDGAPVITDGRDGGDFEHFFFLAPIERSSFTATGPFNDRVRPRVEICRLIPDSGPQAGWACEAELVAWFEMGASSDGSNFVQRVTESGGLPASDSLYSVGWNTDKAFADQTFRVSVKLQSNVLGFADMILKENSSLLQDLGDNYGDVAGRNIPVKFRIEEGAVCQGLDCIEATVTSAGGCFINRPENGGACFPEGWIGTSMSSLRAPGDASVQSLTEAPDVEEVLFVMERITLANGEVCLPTDYPQFEGCYRFRTEPELVEFNLPATIAFCLEPDAYALRGVLGMYRSPEPIDPNGTIEELEGTAFDYIECDAGTLAMYPSGLRGILARAGDAILAPVSRLLGGRPAYAADSGFGSLTKKFSRFGWVMPLAGEPYAGDGQTALIGQTLATPLSIRVTSEHCDDGVDCPIAGVPVTFTVSSGGGSVDPVTALTNADGVASTLWTLGSAEGGQTVEATGPGFGPVVFGATGVRLLLDFGPPLAESFGSSGPLEEVWTPIVRICPAPVSTTPCANAVAVLQGADIKTAEEDGRKSYQTSWKPRDWNVTSGQYRAQVVVLGAAIGRSPLIEVIKSGRDQLVDPDLYLTKSSSDVPLKFRITRP